MPVGTHNDESRLIRPAPIPIGVAYNFQRHAQRFCRLFKREDGSIVDVEGEQAESNVKLFEHVPPGGQQLWREVMTGSSLERVCAVSAAFAMRWAEDYRRALIMRLIG